MTVIDDYLQSVAEPQKVSLERIRTMVHELVPDADEVITYGMPGFKYKGKYLLAFAPFKDHMSLFPGSDAVHMRADKLEGFKLSKGTIQFTTEKELPDDTLRTIILDCRDRIDT